MAHGLELAGIGFHLGAIQRELSQAHKPRSLAQHDPLNEQTGQSTQVTPAKVGDPSVVRLLIDGQNAEGGDFPAGLLDLSGAGQPDAVGVQQQHHHHSRPVGLFAPRILLPEDCVDFLKIQLAGQIQQKEHQVVLWQPVQW